MNREILFRGWCPRNEKWIEGDVIFKSSGALIRRRSDAMCFEVDPSTVCQCTDRNDCKGRRIYEGDIVDRYNHTHNRHMRGIIKFGEYSMPTDAYRIRKGTHLGFYIYWMDEDIRDTYRCDFAWYANALEVIGNIWDMSELLEGGEND